MPRTTPAETKLVLHAHHPFTLWRLPADFPDRLRQRWPAMQVVHLADPHQLAGELAGADVYVGFWVPPEIFRQARKLRWVHATAAGVSQLLFPELVASEVVLTNARGVNAVPIGDHTLAVMLAFSRRLPSGWRHQQARRWAQQQIWDEFPPPMELEGQHLLLVGLGSLGREIAARARGFGMRITAVTRSGAGPEGLAQAILPASHLDEALPDADFVVLAAPETPATRHLIDARRLALMKPGAYLVNVARGTLVDESALAASLAAGRLAGAALDVFEREPLAPESPLWEMGNVLITPHVANASARLWDRQWEILRENLERWFAGQELLNQVDKLRGY